MRPKTRSLEEVKLHQGPYGGRVVMVSERSNLLHVGRMLNRPMIFEDPNGQDPIQRGLYVRSVRDTKVFSWKGWLDVDQS